MTLTVSVMKLNPVSGQMTDEISLPIDRELAGVESWRSSVCGSPESIRLGLKLLCSLNDGHDIVARGAEIGELRQEVKTLLEHLPGSDSIEHWLGNILNACDVTMAHGAAVWIA